MSKNTRRLENTLRPVVRLTMRGPTNWRSTTRGPTSSNLPTLSNQILTKSLYSLIHGCIFVQSYTWVYIFKFLQAVGGWKDKEISRKDKDFVHNA